MIAFIGKRIIQMVIILVGVSLFAFMLSFATGDPTSLLISPTATQAEIDAFRQHMGLDKPAWVQYGRFIQNILRGEFPRSLTYNQNPFTLILERLPATLLLRPTGFDTLPVRIWVEASEEMLELAAPAALMLMLGTLPVLWFLMRQHDAATK